uniref:Uncharacterized protein n=1 Tax=Lepeophtheirus salmonis TaxID=72036 RepID=A0A0K2T918_LEPSM
MRSGYMPDYGQQGNYAQGNTYPNYGPSHATQSSTYDGQNSYSTGGYQPQQASNVYAQSQGTTYGTQGTTYGDKGTTYGTQGSSYVQTEGLAQSAAYGKPQPPGYDQSQSASYGQTNSGAYGQSGGYGQTQTPSYGPAQSTDQTNSGTYGQSGDYGPAPIPDQKIPYPQTYTLQQPYSLPPCPLHCGPPRPVDPPQPPPYSPPIYQSNVLQPPDPYSYPPQQLPNQMYNDPFQFSQPHGPNQPLYKSLQEQPQQYQTPNSNGQASYTQPISFTQENTYESGGSSNSGDDSTYLIGPQTQSFTAAKTGGYASENSNPNNPVTYVEEEKYQSSSPSNDYNAAGVSKRGPSLIDTFYTPL